MIFIQINESYALKVTKYLLCFFRIDTVYISSKSTTTLSEIGCDWQVKI